MLNKQQLEASEIKDERVLVLAGPGTGKTTTLVSRYKYLINQGIKTLPKMYSEVSFICKFKF